ncbi:MAG: DNA/RNA non-specific endonuclease [Bacteroidales bacterium]|nr:DNA/RNA non-specific endonuclease [Bacteroidales bacterium]MBR4740712.1 DNA/RNA non-specific endonuclease [Bacteroidales bacterium]
MNRATHILVTLLTVSAFAACGKDNPNPNNNNNQQGGGSETPKNTPALILSQDFTKGLGSFTVQDKDKGGYSGSIWKYESGSNAKYGAQATAGNGGTKYKAESWLISPEIDLTNYTDANLYFDHAFAYLYNKTTDKVSAPKNHFSVMVSSDGGSTWAEREIPKWLSSFSYFELAQSGNISLSAFQGKKIKFAFVYKSTTEYAPTWEILNVTVSTERQTLLPDDAGDQYKSVPAWMEMPKVTNESAWHAHTTIIKDQRARNYSFSYNESCLVADWVAYPLYDLYAKNHVDRNNTNWEKDPFLKTQSNVAAGGSYEFSTKGYDRGHQIPSADRLGGAMANQQTFYYSNVTPQLHDFNGGIWGNLESAVRGWSSSSNGTDTLYVVTGCLADASCPTVKDHDGNAVAIPKAYYKAVLRLSKGNYIGVGFYLPHENTKKSYREFACSLKELEEKTGMTFFVNLPADKAAAIKAEKPKDNKFWNLN